MSSLSFKLAGFLNDAGFETIVLEQQFGPYSVDVLLADEWIAFEADGEYWHQANSTDYEARDRWLLDRYDLPVVRLTQAEVEALVV